MAGLNDAKKAVARQLAQTQDAEFFPRQVLTQARDALRAVPPEGLTPDVAKVRRWVVSGADGLERMISEAEVAYRQAALKLESIPADGSLVSLDQTAQTLEELAENPAVTRLYMSAGLLQWWMAGLLEKGKTMRDQEAPVGGR